MEKSCRNVNVRHFPGLTFGTDQGEIAFAVVTKGQTINAMLVGLAICKKTFDKWEEKFGKNQRKEKAALLF
ncbi:hypothetical protein BH11BAC5_BH11BAC5_02120 [soil metagenome]